MTSDQVDAYIDSAAEFAVPILRQLRALIHKAIPDIEEEIKWKMPSFEAHGKIICSFAGYKKHCAFRFYPGHLMEDPMEILLPVGKSNMRHIGDLKSLDDLPPQDVLIAYLKHAWEVSKGQPS